MNATDSTLTRYQPPVFEGPVALDLSRNEGRPPADHAWRPPAATALSRYPDLCALQRALGRAFDSDEDRCLVTAGGDDALLRCCLAWLGPGRDALCCTPTFEMIPRYVRMAGARLRTVEWPDGAFPLDAVLAAIDSAPPAVVFVVSPNNPTGAIATPDDLRRLAAASPASRLVVDLAYEEFSSTPLAPIVAALPNAVAVRTLSKAWSLAGLRVGAAIGPPELLHDLAAVGNPMPVSAASAAIAVQRIAAGRSDVRDHVASVQQQRRRFRQLGRELALQPNRSCEGNFVLLRGLDPQRTTASLLALGIAVRRFPDDPALTDAVRVTMPGTDPGYQHLERALRTTFRPAALLFDMDGVLADVSRSYHVAIVATARSFGVALTTAEIAAAKARGNCNDDWQLTRDLMARAGVERSLAEVTDCFEHHYQRLADRESARIDAALLQQWRQRFRLGVVTGRPRNDAERFLARAGMTDLFDTVVCREDAPLKPDPAPVHLALQQLDADTAWMLGDTVDDVRAAAAAGVLPVGVLPPGADPSTILPGAAFTLTSPTELAPLLP